ncbi:23S rRNA (adenine(2030)-N(6))-methyltransferase RlmJ [Vulcaniibacterium tengchongense]|uniref:Ribosomal RNA large subunit methyltransferase J n=1 Tax=Vulcaniibacterium tengchongense TaxID=1273429 RepID=A0A3N4VDU5_9GAMM|nr:23S rRNA (adenine(2030)-N(6))-methyltransferase RlmJ [Vulcaniibacterium tengchongense]RPE81176.1 23S rRNA (adenine2030-N6)-methyltransferase [Vulcaniibacterium tengchongense]
MNYRHAFHAGNHADVLKHVALLALCDALTAKPAPLFALDTHAGRGLYALDADAARRTGEAEGGIGRLLAEAPRQPLLRRYLDAVRACRLAHGRAAYPGSPWLLAHALREQDRIAACELHPEEADVLRRHFAADPRMAVHERDGYAALKALLPPRTGATRYARGLVLIDPPYEAQLDEFDAVLGALRDALARWPQAVYAVWYPIKLRRALRPFHRRAAALPAKSALVAELLVRADDSPLRMNGSGLLLLNPPWQFDAALRAALPALARVLGEGPGAGGEVRWLVAPE